MLTALDTLLILWFARYGIRMIEACVIVLIATMAVDQMLKSSWRNLIWANLSAAHSQHHSQNLYIAVGILWRHRYAHNCILHSALVQTRQIGETPAEIRSACRFNFCDSMLALNAALLVNTAILVVAAAGCTGTEW